MKFITNCKELNPYATSCIKEEMGKQQCDARTKTNILNYLKNGNDAGVRCSVVVDRITGEQLDRTIHRYKDDGYIWSDEDIYHYEQYNIKLNDEFVHMVMGKINT